MLLLLEMGACVGCSCEAGELNCENVAYTYGSALVIKMFFLPFSGKIIFTSAMLFVVAVIQVEEILICGGREESRMPVDKMTLEVGFQPCVIDPCKMVLTTSTSSLDLYYGCGS